MSNIFIIIFIFIFFTNCSFNKNSKFWTNEKIKKEALINDKNKEEIFKKKNVLNLEFNPNLKIGLYGKPLRKVKYTDYSNNNGRILFDGLLQNITKFKFSKIENFLHYNPEVIFEKENIIFFDNTGSIFKFDKNSNLIWKKNYYNKTEKKLKPFLFFGHNNQKLIIADNISKIYALDIMTGDLLWTKNNIAPVNSQVKVYKDKFFVIDFENTMRSFLVNDGTEVWDYETQKSLIRSQQNLSLVIYKNNVIFINSLGDITSVNIDTGELEWQTPTRSTVILEDDFYLKNSDIVLNENSLYFSNNKNQFFSINVDSGLINWEQSINSITRPTLVDDYIFTVSQEGYLIIVEKKSGNIIRITDIFSNFKIKKRKDIHPVGFVVGTNYIYLTTSNGRLLKIEIATGKTILQIKIDKDKVARPSILNENLFLIKENSIIRLN